MICFKDRWSIAYVSQKGQISIGFNSFKNTQMAIGLNDKVLANVGESLVECS